MGGLDSMGQDGGVTVALGAGLAGVPFFLSSVSEQPMERVAAASSGPRVFKLYVRGDDAWVDKHVRRAAAAGYGAFYTTIGGALYSRWERDIANRFAKPWWASAQGQHQAALSWRDIERFKALHRMPLTPKGSRRRRKWTGREACRWRASTSATTAAGNWITAQARSRCCRRSSRRWPGGCR